MQKVAVMIEKVNKLAQRYVNAITAGRQGKAQAR